MKVILCSMIDNFFMEGFEVFIKSLLKHNPWFDLPIRLIDVGLHPDYKKKCFEFYKDIEFVEPQKEKYQAVSFEKTCDALINTYYKLDIFSYEDVDRVVFIDLDTLILDDMSKVFECDHQIAGCLGYAPSGDRLRREINTGLIVLNKRLLNKHLHEDIIHFTATSDGFSMPDQKAINMFLRKRIQKLPKQYNCEKRLWKGKNYQIYFDGNTGDLMYKENEGRAKCHMVHFVSEKPWQDKEMPINYGYEKLEKLWWDVKHE